MIHATRRTVLFVMAIVTMAWAGACAYGVARPLPPGVSFAGATHRGPVEFLYDLTYQTDTGRVVDQTIFNRVFEMIEHADRYVVVDMFLFNGEHGGDREYLPLAERLSQHLIAKKRSSPAADITVLTDEINNFYGAYTSRELSALEREGIRVVLTDLRKLRDSNPGYSALWRLLFQWVGTGGPGLVPHPLTSSGQRVTLRAYLKLLNFKANHRKVIVTDRECLITSANPHTASSFHSNVAFVTTGTLCNDILEAERAVATFSGASLPDWGLTQAAGADVSETTSRYLTEGKIRLALLEHLESLGRGDRLDIAMFYLSDRGVINEIARAAERGVTVRLILDPNKDAFGREKGGIPNRQVAHELRTRSNGSIQVRWYDTHGEQFHTKLVLARRPSRLVALGGSANLTRRNLQDYNLEADLMVTAPRGAALATALETYFTRLWTNDGGAYTVGFEAYEDRSWLKKAIYRMQEWSGFCSY